MTVDQHRVSDPPTPGGVRHEIIQGSLTLTTGTATETITLNLNYDTKPTITGAAGNGATDEEVNLSLTDDDPTSDDTIAILVTAATNEAKEYHVHVVSPTGDGD